MCPGWLSFGFTKFDNIQRTFLKHPAKNLNFPLEGGYGRKFVFLSSVVSALFLLYLHWPDEGPVWRQGPGTMAGRGRRLIPPHNV